MKKLISGTSGTFNNRLLANTRLPETKDEALDCGAQFYYPMTPCANGHISRVSIEGLCQECKKIKALTDHEKRKLEVKNGIDNAAYQREVKQISEWKYE